MSQEPAIPLSSLKQGNKAVVAALTGGLEFQKRLRSMGLNEKKTIRLVAKHHFSGPLVVEIEGRQVTIGRGMASKINVEPEQ